MELKPWKTLSEKPVFVNKWWNIVQQTAELPDGSVVEDYFVSRHGGSGVVFAMTEDGEVVMRRQYKHGCGEIVTELPIGALDPSDASPLDGAKRELLEETGYGEGDWESLGTLIPNPTSSTSRVHAFLARGVRKVKEAEDDPREQGETFVLEYAEALRLIASGEIRSQVSVACALLAGLKLGILETKP